MHIAFVYHTAGVKPPRDTVSAVTRAPGGVGRPDSTVWVRVHADDCRKIERGVIRRVVAPLSADTVPDDGDLNPRRPERCRRRQVDPESDTVLRSRHAPCCADDVAAAAPDVIADGARCLNNWTAAPGRSADVAWLLTAREPNLPYV